MQNETFREYKLNISYTVFSLMNEIQIRDHDKCFQFLFLPLRLQ
jgi:hypothetical protein